MIGKLPGKLFVYKVDMKPERLIQLKPEEEILEVVHETTIPHIPKFLLLVIVLALPFFFLFPLFREGLVGVIIFLILLCIGIILLGRAFFIWSRTVLIVTDRRVVDYDQVGLFSRIITEARFRHVDDVTYQIKGVWATIFRFGTIKIQLRGNAADVEFVHVLRPARITDLINDLRDEETEK